MVLAPVLVHTVQDLAQGLVHTVLDLAQVLVHMVQVLDHTVLALAHIVQVLAQVLVLMDLDQVHTSLQHMDLILGEQFAPNGDSRKIIY